MTKEVLTKEELFAELVNRGGAIVCSTSCKRDEVEEAKTDRRFAVDDDTGICFVLTFRLDTFLTSKLLEESESND